MVLQMELATSEKMKQVEEQYQGAQMRLGEFASLSEEELAALEQECAGAKKQVEDLANQENCMVADVESISAHLVDLDFRKTDLEKVGYSLMFSLDSVA